MEELANGLSLTTRRMVVDETGLAGEFNFDIDYGSVDVGTASGPSIFSALQEQLGLKLESTRVRTEVLQIERAERPTDAAFEVESVRPRPELVARENGRGGPIGGEKCSGRVQADPGRFSITNASIYQLVTLAYGLDPNGLSAGRCLNVTRMGLLSGGPAWVETARFDIEARIPPDSVGDANLQKMLQGLLRERFKLSLRREMKEMPVYVMSVAAGGPRLVSWREGDPASGGAFGLGSDGVAFIAGTRMSTEQLASRLATATNRPVFNRTDVKGEFKFTIRFEPTTDYFTTVVASAMPRPETAANPVNAPTLFSVLQDQLGLRLSAAREKVEVFVIDRVDRPSEN
jgi:uncharacterized protein (TIGR03435 family)